MYIFVVVYHELTTLRRVFSSPKLPSQNKPALALLIHDIPRRNIVEPLSHLYIQYIIDRRVDCLWVEVSTNFRRQHKRYCTVKPLLLVLRSHRHLYNHDELLKGPILRIVASFCQPLISFDNTFLLLTYWSRYKIMICSVLSRNSLQNENVTEWKCFLFKFIFNWVKWMHIIP